MTTEQGRRIGTNDAGMIGEWMVWPGRSITTKGNTQGGPGIGHGIWEETSKRVQVAWAVSPAVGRPMRKVHRGMAKLGTIVQCSSPIDIFHWVAFDIA